VPLVLEFLEKEEKSKRPKEKRKKIFGLLNHY